MNAPNGARPPKPQGASVATVAALLLRAEAHERTGLSRRVALLAAAADMGVEPAAVLGQAGKAVA